MFYAIMVRNTIILGILPEIVVQALEDALKNSQWY